MRAALAALAAALLVLSLPAAAGARPVFGLQGVSEASPSATTHDLQTAARLHARLLRVQAQWSALQPSAAGQWDAGALAELDRVVDGAARRGMKVVLFGDGTPCWASSAPADLLQRCAAGDGSAAGAYGPRDPADFAAFSTFLVHRYGSRLAAYQVWNEPDQASEDYWAGPDKVARYVALVKAVYPAVKQAAPKLPVLAGSFVGIDGKWLTAMYQAGIKGFYDGIAVHFYDLPLYALRVTHAVQRRFGDRTPLWLTEFGWSSCYRRGGPAVLGEHPCVTTRMQARATRDVLSAVRRTPWIRAAVLYNLHDEPGAYRFGVLDLRDRAKPLFGSLRSGARGPMRPPTARLRVQRGRAVVTGTASLADVYEVRASHANLRLTAYLRTDRFGAYRLVLPAAMGTSGISVAVRSTWSGRTARAAR